MQIIFFSIFWAYTPYFSQPASSFSFSTHLKIERFLLLSRWWLKHLLFVTPSNLSICQSTAALGNILWSTLDRLVVVNNYQFLGPMYPKEILICPRTTKLPTAGVRFSQNTCVYCRCTIGTMEFDNNELCTIYTITISSHEECKEGLNVVTHTEKQLANPLHTRSTRI